MSGLYYYEGGDTCEVHTGVSRPEAEERFLALCSRVDKANDNSRDAGVKLVGGDGSVLRHYKNGALEGRRP